MPAHLLVPLRSWIEEVLTDGGRPIEDVARDICVRLHFVPERLSGQRWQYLNALMKKGDPDLLDVVDEVLAAYRYDTVPFLELVGLC